jgi:hypothetical protein
MSSTQIPDVLRAVHLAGALVLGVLIYAPWADDSSAIWISRLAAYPLLTLTGAALWIGRSKAMARGRAHDTAG